MNAKALQTLEFNKILDMLSQHASSEDGRALCLSLQPAKRLATIDAMQEETAAALSRLMRKGNISFGNVRPIGELLKRIEIGGSLQTGELLLIAGLLENAGIAKRYGAKEKESEEDDCLSPMFSMLEPLRPVTDDIRRCILAEDEIADDASPSLSKIRRQIRILRDRVQTELTRIIATHGQTHLQDALVTTRDGRYCVPVKQEHRSAIPGIVHDQSSSGQTLFVEPASVVQLNNDIKQQELEEQKEIDVILYELTNALAPHTEDLLSDHRILRDLDFIFARAHLALDMDATRPLVNEDGIIDLTKARHPLIAKEVVRPIDIRLGEDFSLLVITGPNTGGKTVTLKTIGLLTIMGLSGLHIPCQSNSRLSIFEEVYADIGDEQSIEQSLSTFSSHMTNIVSFLDRADRGSLVLFDELGAGTDPTEGAALAIAILRTLKDRCVRTVATTHYSELKLFALKEEGVENASCEFDVETLSPTYRLLIGIPGKSNAFAISKKLGMSDAIIEDARLQISDDAASFEDVITDLEVNRKKLEEEREEVAATRAEIDALKKELAKKKEELTHKKNDQIRQASEEARNILQNAKEYADRTIRDFAKAKDSGTSIQKLEEKRDKLRHKIDNYSKNAKEGSGKKKKGNLRESDLHVGDRVHILSLDVDAIVNTLPDRSGYLFVIAGIMHTKVHLSDLVKNEEAEITAPHYTKTSAGKVSFDKAAHAQSEIDLLGMTVDEATATLGKFLDDAIMAHLGEVRIVHGKGTGALRAGVHAYLKKQKHIKSFRLGEFGEGDAGVTIAVLK